MFLLKKLMFLILTVIMMVALSACSLGQTATDESTTPPTQDIDAVKTTTSMTASVQLTEIAVGVLATASAAAAVPDTETPTQEPVNTQAPIDAQTPSEVVELTNTPEPSATQSLETPPVAGVSTNTPIPSLTPVPVAGGGGSIESACKNSEFGGDLSIPDGTVMKPGEAFTKTWKVRNIGICTWNEGFYFAAWIGPASMSVNTYYFHNANNYTDPGEAIDIGINMTAPETPGDYVAHWTMFDNYGKQFGSDFTVVIKVVK